MPFVQWDESLAVNIKEIDLQHQKLITLLNQLAEIVHYPENDQPLDEIFKELLQYIDSHFQAEEYYFKQTDYSGSSEHLEEHKFYSRTIRKKYNNYKTKQFNAGDELLEFLSSWFIHHIKNMDMQYRDYLKQRGIQ